ncbi:MAG: 30S ribosomal protein S15 [Candidatus Niyogibacteria bacterium RIFCSPLOWO2_12_FULL_41_13]|uniref:Small ribosomal subunit protein uS15 n=1 Tax=Candidatus Niyogibacteria bacterium RIFCSPLOWO2_12_FULL_41_13 TaxID=1801726 RepID=A0A1G2F220_9BACT|nr:MAG: 30S ribosomal protein S15 [Candidatus Niyogibacteria bacterium RIFCSPLOWO2_12_FULL_41_13]
MIPTKEKQKIIEKYKLHERDTGSAEVQIAVLTEEISRLLKHLEKNKKDKLSRRGLLGMVSKRRTLLNYLKYEDEKRYNTAVKKLKLQQ